MDAIEKTAHEITTKMRTLEMEAQDSLLTAKVSQARSANMHQDLSFPFKLGDRVVLSTRHWRCEYQSLDEHRAAKFMLCFDGPYHITSIDDAHSTVTLDLPEQPNIFPVFHSSEVRPFVENDATRFPEQALTPPAPVAINGHEEFFINKIINQRRRGQGYQYLVRWHREGPEGDKWIAAKELEDCEALDTWQERQGVVANTTSSSASGTSRPLDNLLNTAGSFPHRGFDAPVLSAFAPSPPNLF
jgi:hypothetical protein